MLIMLYVTDELSFDKQHENADQIYRVIQHQKDNFYEGSDLAAVSALPLAPALRQDFPEVEKAAVLRETSNILFKTQQKSFYSSGLYADEYFSEVFTFPVVEGIGSEALKTKDAIILTESLARKYFGFQANYSKLIGKTILLDEDKPMTVKGIIEDPKPNQHFHFDFLISLKNHRRYQREENSWKNNSYYTYIILKEGTNPVNFEEKLLPLSQTYEDGKGNSYSVSTFLLQKLTDIHLDSHINFGMEASGDIRYVYTFSLIGLIILLLAAINYMNLATARSGKRAKEVGMRKVIGAKRSELVYQFLGESFLFTFFSFLLAIGFMELLLPAYNQLLGKEITFNWFQQWEISLGMFSFSLLIGLLSGLYPALFISALTPIKALKGTVEKSYKSGSILRNGLVIGQFTATVILALGSFIVYQQLDYIQNKKLGLNKEQIVLLPMRGDAISDNASVLKQELLTNPNIKSTSFFNFYPITIRSSNVITSWEGNHTEEQIMIYYQEIDHEYLNLFEIELAEGRNFSLDRSSDYTIGYILNEAALRTLGWKTAVGKKFDDGIVVGVVKDYHFQRLNHLIEPLYMEMIPPEEARRFAVKIQGDKIEEALAHIEESVQKIAPEVPFTYEFMDEAYNKMYNSEKRFGKTFSIFTILALLIASLGLWSLASFMTERRIKEIGIRKVLGASVGQIVTMLWSGLLKPIILAILIGTPIAYYLTTIWLEDFAYKIELTPEMFMFINMGTLLIACGTVSYHSIKSAIRNPVESLRSE